MQLQFWKSSWTTTFLISATLDRASTPIRPGGEYSDEVVNETEAMAVEADAVDFPEVCDDRKDEATRCDVMTEEVFVPQREHLIPGGRV